MEYRKATIEDLEKIWDKDILDNPNDENYVRWKHQYIQNNILGKCATFVAVDDNTPIAQVTVLFSTDCSAVKDRPMLCDGKIRANMNAFRIETEGGIPDKNLFALSPTLCNKFHHPEYFVEISK